MTVLISGGDSFTYGSELSDCTNEQHSNSTWSALLAHQLGMNYACVALPGASNNSISRRVMRACENMLADGQDIAVAVMWSFANRTEFRFNKDTGERDSPWYSITPWVAMDNDNWLTTIQSHFVNENPIILKHHMEHNRKMQESGIADFAKSYYMHIGNEEIWEYYTTYKEIMFLQQYLDSKNIPYVFTHVEPLFVEISVDADLTVVRNQINMDKFYKFEGFYRWATENNYEFGTTHPLESAHVDFADLLFKHCKANNII